MSTSLENHPSEQYRSFLPAIRSQNVVPSACGRDFHLERHDGGVKGVLNVKEAIVHRLIGVGFYSVPFSHELVRAEALAFIVPLKRGPVHFDGVPGTSPPIKVYKRTID